MFHYVSCLIVFNKEVALKNVHLIMVFTDSFTGPLHKISNSRIQSCINVKSIYSYSSHTAFSEGLRDNNFSQAEKCVTKITKRQPLPSTKFNSFRCPCVSTLIRCITTLIPYVFRISTQIPCIPMLILCNLILIPSSHSQPYSLDFPHSILQFPILAFTDSLLSFYSL